MTHENAVLKGLESMREYDGHGEGLSYSQDGKDYTVDEMIEEIRAGTEIGNRFSQNVYEMVLTYMGKFSQDAD